MFDSIINWDRQVFVYLNSLGSPAYDEFWLAITHQFHWTPLFLLLLYIIYTKLGWKQFLVIILFFALLGLVTDQTSNLFKNGFARLRPNNDPTLIDHIRILKHPQSFSFISGHASNSIAITTFLFLLLRKKVPSIKYLYLWPLVFAYSRIYLGLHFPLDILCGYAWGISSGILHYKGYAWVREKYFTIPE